MKLTNSATHYGPVAKFLHWGIFLLFVNQFVSAALMLWMAGGDLRSQVFGWHKAFGLLALMVAFLRIGWRQFTPLPDWAPRTAEWEKPTTQFIERSLYLLMIIMPLSGLLVSLSGGHGVQFFGFFRIPGLAHPNEIAASVGWFLHRVTSYGIIAMVSLHVGFVVRHSIFEKDGFLRRMLPFV